MQAEYKRDMSHSYLVLQGEQPSALAAYPMRMLAENQIPSLLSVRLQGIDGGALLYYDITGKQSLQTIYERKSYCWEDLESVLKGIVKSFHEMAAYLLWQEDLVLLPEYMYMDAEKKEVFLCYFPGYQQEIQKQFQGFIENLLPKIDTKDERAMETAYRLYRRGMKKGFQVESIKEELYQICQREEENDNRTFLAEDERQAWPEEEPEEELASFLRSEERQKEKNHPGGWGYLLAGILCFCGAAFWRWAYLPVHGGILWSLGGILCILSGLWRLRIKKKKTADGVSGGSENSWKQPSLEEKMAQEKNCPKAENESEEESMETTVLYQNTPAGVGMLASKLPNQYPTIFLEKEMVVIGKLEVAADVLLNSSAVSRVHARICKKEGEYYLTDLNSRNGTCVNGRLLQGEEEYLLKTYDEICFADVQYIFLK